MHYTDILTSVFDESSDIVTMLDDDDNYVYFNLRYKEFCQSVFGSVPEIGTPHLEQLNQLIGQVVAEVRRSNVKTTQHCKIRDADYELTSFVILDVDEAAVGLVYILKQSYNQVNINGFLTSLVHDLKNPVSSIIGLAQILEHQTTNQVTEAARIIGRAAERLISIIDDVMLINRYTYHPISITYEDVNVEKMVRDILEVSSKHIVGKNLSVECDLKTRVAKTSTTHLRHILSNIIDNAIKYSNNNGVVRITSDTCGDSLVVTVSDTGIGISNRNLPNLFQPFTRFTTNNGTGLGLYIAKTLTDQLAGKITVHSVLDEGSTFTCEIPNH